VAGFLWGTNTLPLAVTGIVVLCLLPVSGALTQGETYAYFGNQSIFFILGAFILASPVMRSGLSARLALWVVSHFGQTQGALVGSILGLSTAMSFVISEHAVAAMLLPVVLELMRATGAKPGGHFGLVAFLALGWGTSIGGTATLLGGARAPLAIGVLKGVTGQSISFSQWMVWSVPTVLILVVVAYVLLRQIEPDPTISLAKAQKFLSRRSQSLGPMSSREIGTAWVVCLTVLLWIVRGETWGLDVIAFLGVILSFVLRIADWREVEEDVNWGIFVMYGSAIALSAALRDTGAAESLVQYLLASWVQNATLMFGVIVLLAVVLTEAMSNAATVAVLMPVGLALATQYGLDPRAITMGVAFPAGLALMLPVSTPGIAILVGSGFVTPAQVFQRGLGLKLAAIVVFLLMSQIYWPLVGLQI